ncbi:ATP-binding protein [Ferrovibrio terrae]|uniref:sensor histidine kinase n=1 Tax=Ferrovibrio terrae TaxID=2594003 RepID=UPI003137E166
MPYLLTSLALIGAGLAAHIVTSMTAVVAVSLFFVPVVLFSALAFGLFPAIYAAMATVMLAAYFFYVPIFSLAVEDPVQIVDLMIFTGVAAVVGPLADWARRSARQLKQREIRMQQLYEVGRHLAAVAETAQIPQAIAEQVMRVTGRPCAILLPEEDRGPQISAQSGGAKFVEDDLSAATSLWSPGPARTSPDMVGGAWKMYVIRHGEQPVGILALHGAGSALEPVFMAALLELIATALERMRLAERSEIARIDAKADQLRDAIISSISHDLRTPLAAILGSASTLEGYGTLCSEAERQELAAAIREEAERLEHFLGRLFDLTRIRAGRLHPVLEPVDLVDVVEAAMRRCRPLLAGHESKVELAPYLPMVYSDAILLQQALVNILENAAKYAAPGTIILVGAFRAASHVELFIRDSGRGMTAEQSRQVFDHFYRATDRAGEPGGSGLGLTISRAFIEACGGSIVAESAGLGQGTTMRIKLPLAESTADGGDEAGSGKHGVAV